MQNLESLFNAYSKDHQNPLNQKIHYYCVPLIVYSLMGLLWSFTPLTIGSLDLNWAVLFALGVTLYYSFLSLRLAIIMALSVSFFFFTYHLILTNGWPLTKISIAIFILAWIGQFYGHKVEGQKPSFLTDITYLFIGPLWVVEKLLGRTSTK